MKNIIIKIISFFSLLRYRLKLGNKLKIGKNVVANFRLVIRGKGSVMIGDNVNLWAHKEKTELFTFCDEAKIIIGNGSRLNGSVLQARESVVVGENCLIGSGIIMDNDFHHVDVNKRFSKVNIPTAPVIVGKNVWLSGQSAILKGVNVGDNSVVGFRAVVAKNVDENVVVVGNPAKVVREL